MTPLKRERVSSSVKTGEKGKLETKGGRYDRWLHSLVGDPGQ